MRTVSASPWAGSRPFAAAHVVTLAGASVGAGLLGRHNGRRLARQMTRGDQILPAVLGYTLFAAGVATWTANLFRGRGHCDQQPASANARFARTHERLYHVSVALSFVGLPLATFFTTALRNRGHARRARNRRIRRFGGSELVHHQRHGG